MITFYKSKNNWRWHVKGKNNKIIAASSEGFKKKAGAIRNADLTFAYLLAWQNSRNSLT